MALVEKSFEEIITFTRASEATYFGSDGLMKTAAVDEPRIDYDPITLEKKGLLMEERRTNVCTWSSDLTKFSKRADTVVTANAGTGITANYTKIQNDVSVNGIHSANPGGDSADKYWTGSVYLAAVSGTTQAKIFVGPFQGGSDPITTVICDLTTTPKRFDVTMLFKSTAMSGTFIDIAPMEIGIPILANYVNIEEGKFPTSYIPTTTVPVTRQQDIAKVFDASEWTCGPKVGTYVVEYEHPDLSAGRFEGSGDRLFGNDSSQWAPLQTITDKAIGTYMPDGGIGNITLQEAPLIGKAAITFDDAGMAGAFNGVYLIGTGKFVDITNSISLLTAGNNNNILTGWIKALNFYPYRFTQQEMIDITTPISFFGNGENGWDYESQIVSDWRYNKLLWSEKFNNTAAWISGSRETYIGQVVGPDGSMNAQRWSYNSQYATPYQNPASLAGATDVTGQVWARLESGSTADLYQTFQQNGGSSAIVTVPVTLTSEWKLISNTATFNGTGTSVGFYPIQMRGNTGLPIVIDLCYGQIEPGLIMSPYQKITDGVQDYLNHYPNTKLYQDLGVVPVSAKGQVVGLIKDDSKGWELGPERITNGNFDSGLTGWTAVGTAILNIVDGAMEIDAGTNPNWGAGFTQTTAPVATNQAYELSMKITALTNGNRIRIVYGGVQIYSLSFAVGVETKFTCTAVSTQNYNSGFTVYLDTTVSNDRYRFDDISIKEAAGNPATLVTFETRPVYQEDADGKGYLDFTGGKSLVTKFKVDMGNECTLGLAVSPEAVITQNNTIGTTYTHTENNYASVCTDDNLTALEEAELMEYLNYKAGN